MAPEAQAPDSGNGKAPARIGTDVGNRATPAQVKDIRILLKMAGKAERETLDYYGVDNLTELSTATARRLQLRLQELEQNHEVFTFPGRATDRCSSGRNTLIREGRAKLVTSIEDILEELVLTVAVQQLEIKAVLPGNDEERKLLALLSHEPVHVDELVRQTALPASSVASTMMMLELKGAVRQVGAMAFVLAHLDAH